MEMRAGGQGRAQDAGGGGDGHFQHAERASGHQGAIAQEETERTFVERTGRGGRSGLPSPDGSH